jgi:aminoglycoside phosphotransferase
MAVLRKWGENHISKALKQVHSDCWLLGSFILRRLPYQSNTATWNDESDGSSYVLEKSSSSHLAAISHYESSYVQLVHQAGDASAVWTIGSVAFCKVKYVKDGVTPEPSTLQFIHDQQSSFNTPDILAQAIDEDKVYLFLQRLPGRTLDQAWPSLDNRWRLHYVTAIVDVCKEMARWDVREFGGVDNQNIPEYYLQRRGSDGFSSLKSSCEEIGMDCSDLAFYHADLGPTNIIVEDKPKSGAIGVIDFEIAGYLPRDWIRTKFRLSSGMNLSESDDPTWLRAEVQKLLGREGFRDFSSAYMSWTRR